MQGSGLITVFYRICEWVVRFFIANVLWLIFNLPIVYLAFNVFLAKSPDHLLANLLLIALLTPFCFFPATSALFGVVRKWILGNSDNSILKLYVKSYKENYVKSMAGGIFFTILWSILIIDYFYFMKLNSPFIYLFVAMIGAYIFVITLHFLSNTVHVHLTLRTLLKNSFLLGIGRPVQTICIALCCIAVLYISFNVFTAFIILGMGSAAAFVSFYFYYKAVPRA
ncbi:DUF624 domain-containing protein [Fictibacillus enclensis]|uniref:YesL family protein n=1 Tax=Fictibacillus enclensis TaxID=1017270 RepID=UPI0025A025A8|nr:DUF624 domain-containing protein [Fictibacillus enclensis]MDM5338544.1 DUF624 domain-containing protein [Fictibacillus enclensis]